MSKVSETPVQKKNSIPIAFLDAFPAEVRPCRRRNDGITLAAPGLMKTKAFSP